METVEESKGAQAGFLYDIFRIMVIACQPAGQIVRSIQVRQDGLFKVREFVLFWQVFLPAECATLSVDCLFTDFIPGA